MRRSARLMLHMLRTCVRPNPQAGGTRQFWSGTGSLPFPAPWIFAMGTFRSDMGGSW
jgi:hypothetical protein